ncbi:D-3-phosphoglycerate dehydrogenase [Salmonella enterica subsp. enterica serovar Typhi]|nr:D-3-phosphoglycerate dehydrogenase [Salmonella enterica subsp. enterica serovar Typhi]
MAKVSLEKDKIKFLLVEGVHQKALESLRAAGYTNIEYHKGALDAEQLKASIRDAHFIGLRSRTHLTEEVINAAEKLVAIGCFCIGTNQVDLNAAAKRGIPVFNAPFSNTRSVAELVIGELLLLLRGVPEANAKAHRGVWNKLAAGSFEARGKKLGIIGYGHIGTQLGILAESLGMHIYFYDIENKLPLGNATQVQHLSELLNMSDVVSLHVPENASTKNMMGAKEIALMKPGSLLINAAPGKLALWRISARWKNAVRGCLSISWRVKFTTNLIAMARAIPPITPLSAAAKMAVSCITLKTKVKCATAI